jgi:hypothetical protein
MHMKRLMVVGRKGFKGTRGQTKMTLEKRDNSDPKRASSRSEMQRMEIAYKAELPKHRIHEIHVELCINRGNHKEILGLES